MHMDVSVLYPAAAWMSSALPRAQLLLKAERVWLLTSRMYAALHCASLGLLICCYLYLAHLADPMNDLNISPEILELTALLRNAMLAVCCPSLHLLTSRSCTATRV